jgi:hypothetical protein
MNFKEKIATLKEYRLQVKLAAIEEAYKNDPVRGELFTKTLEFLTEKIAANELPLMDSDFVADLASLIVEDQMSLAANKKTAEDIAAENIVEEYATLGATVSELFKSAGFDTNTLIKEGCENPDKVAKIGVAGAKLLADYLDKEKLW